jgi:uncharacterized membrane protein
VALLGAFTARPWNAPELRRELLGVHHQCRGRAIDTIDGLVARERVGAAFLELRQTLAITLARRLVRCDGLLEERAQVVVRRGRARVLQLDRGVALAVLERLPVAVESLRVLAAQQDVLPFLHLLLERDGCAKDRALRLEVLPADPVEILDRSVHARDGGDADADGNGHHAGHQHQYLELEAAKLHWGSLLNFEVELDLDGTAGRAGLVAPL